MLNLNTGVGKINHAIEQGMDAVSKAQKILGENSDTDKSAEFADVLAKQMHVIEGGLIPVSEHSVVQADTFQQMRAELVGVLSDLNKILTKCICLGLDSDNQT